MVQINDIFHTSHPTVLQELYCLILIFTDTIMGKTILWLVITLLLLTASKSALKDEEDTAEVEVHEAATIISDYTKLQNNDIHAVGADSYSLYKQLMEVKQQLTSTNNTNKEPAAVSTLKSALSLLYDSLLDGVFKGFFPHVERQRREASDEKRVYLDIAVTTIGAVMGKQNCSKMIACR